MERGVKEKDNEDTGQVLIDVLEKDMEENITIHNAPRPIIIKFCR